MQCVLLAGVVVCLVGASAALAGRASRSTLPDLYVSPAGSDTSSGTSSAKPLRTVQAALARVQPGTTVHLAAGTYRETPQTVRDGTAAAPITIRGPVSTTESRRAVITGTGRIFKIDNSHYRLRSFTIDGQPNLAGTTFPTSLGGARAFKDGVQSRVADSKLLYIGSGDGVRGVDDVVVSGMLLRRAGGECVRIRNDSYGITLSASTIEWCGLQGTGDDSTTYRYHNGEGVYIGTSPKSTDQPLAGKDATNHVTVEDNTIRTYGSECVDVKEMANHNTIAGNLCADDDEPASFLGSLVELRGYANSVEANTISDSRGYGVKISSDDSARYGIAGNAIRRNGFARLAAPPLRTSRTLPAGDLCGNTYDGPRDTSLTLELVAACPGSSAPSGRRAVGAGGLGRNDSTR